MAESPGSPLSSLATDDLTEDLKPEDRERSQSFDAVNGLRHMAPMPPTKRQKTGPAWEQRLTFSESANDTETDISSDTSGEVPGSPTAAAQVHDEEAVGHEQVTVCHWEGCTAGNLGNMDSLVDHIHDDHIGTRQKKYACEWDDCIRKGMPHASGYALRAHMRSHTKEKPFFCQLPECDRSFTRSDALAKHMRTVHETEALRPSDPVPRNHSNPPPRPQRIKLILSSKPPDERHNGDDAELDMEDDDNATMASNDVDGGIQVINPSVSYPSDLHLTAKENAMPPGELFRLLRRQLHWAEDERQELQAEVEALENKKKREWQKKELLLENVMEAELAYHSQRRGGLTNGQTKKILPEKDLPLVGEIPWYRKAKVDADGAVVEPKKELSTG